MARSISRAISAIFPTPPRSRHHLNIVQQRALVRRDAPPGDLGIGRVEFDQHAVAAQAVRHKTRRAGTANGSSTTPPPDIRP